MNDFFSLPVEEEDTAVVVAGDDGVVDVEGVASGLVIVGVWSDTGITRRNWKRGAALAVDPEAAAGAAIGPDGVVAGETVCGAVGRAGADDVEPREEGVDLNKAADWPIGAAAAETGASIPWLVGALPKRILLSYKWTFHCG